MTEKDFRLQIEVLNLGPLGQEPKHFTYWANRALNKLVSGNV